MYTYPKPESSQNIWPWLLFLAIIFFVIPIIACAVNDYVKRKEWEDKIAAQEKERQRKEEYYRQKKIENERRIQQDQLIQSYYVPLETALKKLNSSAKSSIKSSTLKKHIVEMENAISSFRKDHPDLEVGQYYLRPLNSAKTKLSKMEAWEKKLEEPATSSYTVRKVHKPVNPERKKMSNSLRYDIMKRDGFRCCICGRSADDGVKLHVDHIVPIAKGGKTVPENLRTLCADCNLGKSDKLERCASDRIV